MHTTRNHKAHSTLIIGIRAADVRVLYTHKHLATHSVEQEEEQSH